MGLANGRDFRIVGSKPFITRAPTSVTIFIANRDSSITIFIGDRESLSDPFMQHACVEVCVLPVDWLETLRAGWVQSGCAVL